MASTTFEHPNDLLSAVGQELGVSDWLLVDQERINLFADATGDHQWIHVDTERAKTGPFGATIAHGYLTLALSNLFLPSLIEVKNISMGLNYGMNKVRFPAPVKVGSRVRARASIQEAEAIRGGVQAVILITMVVEGLDRPGCVIESVTRYLA